MKTVAGEIISTRPVSLAKASKVLSQFVTVDNGASPAIGIYLQKASEAFDELVQFHKGVRTPNCDRKSRKASSLVESVNIPSQEIETEDAGSNQRKHKSKDKKLKGEFGNATDAVVENGEVNVNSNGAEDVDGKKKKKGDVSMGIGEDETVKEGRDRGKKRKREMTGDGRDKDVSIEQLSKKKKKKKTR